MWRARPQVLLPDSGITMTSFELDHVFICTDPRAPAGDLLCDFGLIEAEPNVHPGQGTANRRFFFHNAMLELLWVHDSQEAQNARTLPTRLWERWNGRKEVVPFGLCLRPRHTDTKTLPFEVWEYSPDYLKSPDVIYVGDNSDLMAEPMLFYSAFGIKPDQCDLSYPLRHETGFNEITSVQFQIPQPGSLSTPLCTVMEMGIVTIKAGQPLMVLGFDGQIQNQSMDFRPQLPLVLRY